MTDAQKRLLGTVVRWCLMLVFVTLTKHKVADGPLVGVVVDDTTAQIVGWIGSSSVLLWSAAQKWDITRKIRIALGLPSGATEADVNAVLKAQKESA